MMGKDISDPEKRGDVVWHTSEEGGGPDVGIHIRIGGDVTMWCGEITRKEWENLDDEDKAALGGNDNGWWIILYEGLNNPRVLARCVERYQAMQVIDILCAGLRA